MNTRQLEYVIVLAEERSFTKAANRLIIAQSSLSQYINNLEQSLGHRLFDRSVTPLRLTVAGELYIETAREILDLDKQINARLRDMDDIPYGRLLLGASPHHCLYTLPRAVKRFLDKYPLYDVLINEKTHVERIRLLEKGELDFCLSMLPNKNKRLECEEVLVESLLIVVSKEHEASEHLRKSAKPGNPYPIVDLRELSDIPFLAVSEKHNLAQVVTEMFNQAEVQPRTILRCESAQVCHAMASAGIGVAILHSGCDQYSEGHRTLDYYSILQEYPTRHLGIFYRKDQYISRAASDFIAIMKSLNAK